MGFRHVGRCSKKATHITPHHSLSNPSCIWLEKKEKSFGTKVYNDKMVTNSKIKNKKEV